jgi:glutathione peroxidase-family protein
VDDTASPQTKSVSRTVNEQDFMKTMMNLFLLTVIKSLTTHAAVAGVVAVDQHESCSYWASLGECNANPNYMLTNCAKSCESFVKPTQTNIPTSFYSIIEKDLNGQEINFEQFRGKIVYVVNVASQCGYTAENYEILKSLSPLRSNKFEILIFPCNQFGAQEPGNPYQISEFATSRGFNGIIMSKGDVNGPNTRPTFEFLKQTTTKKQIGW